MPSGCVCAWGGVDVEVNDSRLLATLNAAGGNTLGAYLRNVRLALYDKAQQVYMEAAR